MCNDIDFDVASDASDSSFDIADDVSSDFEDSCADFDDVGTEDFSIDDIGDDSFSDIDDSVDFDDSFEMDDISDDFDIGSSEEIETLEFEDGFDSADEFEVLEIDDSVSFDDDIETLELDDSDLNIADEFGTTYEINELSLEDNIDYDLYDVSANVETLEFDEDFSDESSEEVSDELEMQDIDIESVEDDLSNEMTNDEIQNENIDTSIDLSDEILDNDSYEATPISEIPIVDEYGNVDTLENIINDNSELIESQMETDPYGAILNEYNDLEFESPEVEPYEATPIISDLPISYEDDESTEEIDGYNDENFEEFNNIENEIPEITDEGLAEFVDWENQRENGNYELINDIMNDVSLTDEQKEFMIQQLLNEGENEITEFGQRVKGLTYDGRDIITKPNEFETNFEQTEQIDDIFNGELGERDIDAVYEGLESYDFQGVDCFEDIERLDSSLESFTFENWEQLSLDEQKEKMTDLADYIIDVTGLENPPRIEFYNNAEEGDYGGFDRITNTLSINEHMLYQNDEAADTIAHELWHALQYQHALNPRTKLDAMYAENFIDYISPRDDFEGYQSQILEAEARAFAQQIKDRLHSY